MTGLPTLSLKLDDGTGSYPYDITTYGRWADGWSFNRGRGDENSEVQTGTLNVVLDNTDGRFTLGNVTYGITTDRLVQLKETVGGTPYTRYTGYIETVPTEWPDGGDAFAVARLVAVDRLARLGRRTLRSMLEQEHILAGVRAYYILAEPEGSLTAGDTSGTGQPALTQAFNIYPLAGGTVGPAVSFGTGVGPGTDGLTAAVFGSAPLVDGKHLETDTLSPGTFAGLSLSIWFVIPAAGTAPTLAIIGDYVDIVAGGGGMQIAVTASGFLNLQAVNPAGLGPVVASGASVCDGLLHHALVTWDGTTTRGYLDGALLGTSACAGTPTISGKFSVGQRLGGTLSHVAVFPTTLAAGTVTNIYNAGLNGFATDRADQRIARLASYANIPVGDQNLETGQQTSIAPQSTNGVTALAAIQAVAQAEGGVAFILGDGKLVLHNKSHRPLKATGAAAIALTADQVNPDLAFGGEKSYLYNTATGSRNGGASQRSVNAASVALYEEYPVDRSVALLPTDGLVLNMLTWLTTMYSSPRTRLGALTLDLMSLPQATVQALLALEIGDRITVGSLPAQSPVATADLILEGLSERQSTTEWTLTLNTVPSAVYVGWILQDATYGVLGTTTIPYF